MRHDLAAHGRAGLCERADPARFATLAPHLHDLAAANGWSTRRVKDTNIGLRIVLGIQDDPNAPIPASDVTLLQQIALPVWTVLTVLDRAGELIEDRIPALDRWYAQQIVGLPEPMTTELAVWFDLMHHGSASPPRRRPRSDTTIQLHVRWALPALRAWADDGHQSLREITVENLLDVLPAAGNARSTAGQGLRSIFRLLKAQKVVFIDPTRKIQIGKHESRIPMPADIRLIRDRLGDPDPATAAVVALIAFHGLRPGHLRRLTITDARDGHLRVDGRVVPLAQPAQQRLSAYLTHRNSTWPNTANPHIFITRRTSHQDVPVSSRWIFLKIGPGLTASRIREDRILDETNATAGDVRVMTDLFGVSVQSLTRYTATLEDPQPGTRDPTHD